MVKRIYYALGAGICSLGLFGAGIIIGARYSSSRVYDFKQRYKEQRCVIVENKRGGETIFVEKDGRFMPLKEFDKWESRENKRVRKEILRDFKDLKLRLESDCE